MTLRGLFLRWHDPILPIWHYGIGLDETHIFDTGTNRVPFEASSVRYEVVDGAYSPDIVVIRLELARQVFANVGYSLLTWNCEHYARLVATGVAESLEVKRWSFGLINHRNRLCEMLFDSVNLDTDAARDALARLIVTSL